MPGLLLVLAIAAVLALAYPTPSATLEALPRAIVDRRESSRTR